MIEKEYKKSIANPIVENMIKNNQINNILEYKIIENKIIYNIDGKISLSEVIGNQVNSNELIKLISDVSEILTNLQSYMITSNNIYLNLKDIYMNQNRELFLMINPALNTSDDIKTMYQNIYLNKIIGTNHDSINLIKINNYFNSEDYSVSGLKRLISNIFNEKKIVFEEEKLENFSENNNRSKKTTLKSNRKNTIFSRLFSSKEQNIVNKKNV